MVPEAKVQLVADTELYYDTSNSVAYSPTLHCANREHHRWINKNPDMPHEGKFAKAL
jgi:hypothetical protein